MTVETRMAIRSSLQATPVLLAFMLSFVSLVSLVRNGLEEIQRSGSDQETIVRMEDPIDTQLPSYQISKDPLSLLTPEIQSWKGKIYRWAEEFDLQPEFIATVMQIESCGHPTVQSRSGALGLFQVMPFHFHFGEDPLDPDTNARRGLQYLAQALELAGGEMPMALAGYNGGHSLIGKDPTLWPDETQRYVYWGSSILEDIQIGGEQSPGLHEWLTAGGETLCRRAQEYLVVQSHSPVE